MGNLQLKYSIIFFLAAALAALSFLAPLVALAQATATPTATFNEHWFTPTPTSTRTPSPTPSATPGLGTPSATPTMTHGPGTPTTTPTGVAMPNAVPFPFPHYGAPTSIPVYRFPSISTSGYSPATLTIPSPIASSYTPSPFNTPGSSSISSTDLITISTGLELDYSTPAGPGYATGTPGPGEEQGTGMADVMEGWIGEAISYTNWISGEVAAVSYTGTFEIFTAPDWYAPPLPRPLADVGWTFEQLRAGIDAGQRYSVAQWSWFMGEIVSLPIQFIKVLWQIVEFMGPFGLFLAWLLIMLPVVLFFKLWLFIKNLFINLVNLVISILGFLLELIKLFL